TPEGARSVLSTISGSMITVTGVILSTMIVVLTLASQQYGPRLVKNFIEDRPSQFVVGAFAGCFIYTVITLKNITSGGQDFVPHISVLVAVLLAMFCIGLMIFFVQHVASSIQVQSIMRRVYNDLNGAIDSLFPENLAEAHENPVSLEEALEKMDADGFSVTEITTANPGYVQLTHDADLIDLAVKHDLLIELKARPGTFLLRDAAYARVRSKGELGEQLQEDLRSVFIVGVFPTAQQDALFPIRQMEEIAIRALSPGINDPHTAEECIDYLTCAMRRLGKRDWPSSLRHDDKRELRVIAQPYNYETLLRQAFQQIHFSGREDISIVTKIVNSLNLIIASLPEESTRRQTAINFTQELIEESRHSLPFDAHRERTPECVAG
ncbi:MAG: DUF2254 domain-containing protein, partial [Puniceicoccales bacterium]